MSEGTVLKFAISGILMASPLWLDPLQHISTIAALVAPIVGVIVGVLTAAKLVRDWWRKG